MEDACQTLTPQGLSPFRNVFPARHLSGADLAQRRPLRGNTINRRRLMGGFFPQEGWSTPGA
eukprot:2529386-Amphidinium_carterae.1